MANPSLLLALLTLLLAGLQAPVEPSPAATSPRSPITVHLITVVDYPDVLGGQRVRVPVVAVKHVIGPRLVVVGEPRIREIDRTYDHGFRFDKLLVLLPGAATLARGQVITLTGDVRTVGAARAMGLPVDARNPKDGKSEKMRWVDEAPLLVADSAETVDGFLLVVGRSR
jgi:hypothetical protein